jgi:pyruvate ferredoxin oxidoreductase beta subunit
MAIEVNKRFNIKELASKGDRLAPGHRFCAGCGAPIIVRQVLNAIESPVVVANATGCLEVATTIYPYTAWKVPWIHTAFENAAATISGVEAMYKSLRRQGKIEDRKIKFVAFGGDGGTYDIGFQSLSGALERGHQFLYVCYDNQGYMNTGIQRSSATPRGAATTTSPAGKKIPGKTQFQKDLTAIIAAHDIPYVAQASIHRWKDLMTKVRKAVALDGPSFINVYAPCNRGWRMETKDAVKHSQLAVDCCYWPVYEVEYGQWRLNYRPRKKLPVENWLESEGRFKHLLNPENKQIVEELQNEIDRRWNRLVKRCQE